jgi:hypothetical protein
LLRLRADHPHGARPLRLARKQLVLERLYACLACRDLALTLQARVGAARTLSCGLRLRHARLWKGACRCIVAGFVEGTRERRL